MRYRPGMGEEPNPVQMMQKKPKKQELKSSSPVKLNTALIVILQRPIGVKKARQKFSTISICTASESENGEMLVSPDKTYLKLQLRYTHSSMHMNTKRHTSHGL